MVSFTQRVTVPSDVLMREVAGESVILNLDTETYFGLDETGTRMWLTLTESETIQHAYESLLAEYDVESDTLRNDLIKLIEELVSHGLLEIRST
jgi:hypothetical protein